MLKKILKDTAILTALIFIIKFVLRLIINPDSIIRTFEKGVWIGLGVYFTSLLMIYVVIFVILFVRRVIFKPKNS